MGGRCARVARRAGILRKGNRIMATLLDALRAVKGEPKLSGEVAARLWPEKEFRGSANGGPTGGQRAASGLMGRLKKRGLVRSVFRRSDPRTYWVATVSGLLFLDADETQRKPRRMKL